MIEAHYITHSGDDLLVVNAARVSFAKRSEWEHETETCFDQERAFDYGTDKLSDRDEKLIRYLAEHQHWTPFAHPQITLHIKAPIFVARQCFKHKVGFVENEVSRRYVDDDPDFFTPEWRYRAKDKKQGSAGTLADDANSAAEAVYDSVLDEAIKGYGNLLELGVAPEQARMVLPQSMMTEWFWTGSLAAWARFCRQRMGKDAQVETGDVARAADAIIAPLFPVSWAALTA